MKRRGDTVIYSADELREMIARGEDLTDWDKVGTMTEEELEAAIASDPDEAGLVWDWSSATLGVPPPPQKRAISLRIDEDILAFFKEAGPGYQTRINASLRRVMTLARRQQARKAQRTGGGSRG